MLCLSGSDSGKEADFGGPGGFGRLLALTLSGGRGPWGPPSSRCRPPHIPHSIATFRLCDNTRGPTHNFLCNAARGNLMAQLPQTTKNQSGNRRKATTPLPASSQHIGGAIIGPTTRCWGSICIDQMRRRSCLCCHVTGRSTSSPKRATPNGRLLEKLSHKTRATSGRDGPSPTVPTAARN